METIRIKSLTVQVTYQVGLGEIDIPVEVYNELANAYDDGEEIDSTTPRYFVAAEWLSDNIKEADCCSWQVEVQDLDFNETE